VFVLQNEQLLPHANGTKIVAARFVLPE